MTKGMTNTIPETCNIWDTNYNSDNWEPEFMTIFVVWQLRVTLDSIRNSCDVCYWNGWELDAMLSQGGEISSILTEEEICNGVYFYCIWNICKCEWSDRGCTRFWLRKTPNLAEMGSWDGFRGFRLGKHLEKICNGMYFQCIWNICKWMHKILIEENTTFGWDVKLGRPGD